MESKKEIEFLKNELKSKNLIIEILQQTVDSLERNQFNKNYRIKSQDESLRKDLLKIEIKPTHLFLYKLVIVLNISFNAIMQ